MPAASLTFFSISGRSVLRVLALGFVLVVVLLGAGGWVAVRQGRLIREGLAQLTRDQLVIARLAHEVQIEENAMTEVLHRVAQFDPKPADVEVLLRELDESERQLARLAAEARGSEGSQQWVDLEASVKPFTAEVHRVLAGTSPVPRANLERLFVQHDRVVELVNEIIRSSSERLRVAEGKIQRQSEALGEGSARLLGASLILAVSCALMTMAFARQSIFRIQWQAGELERVSWHMLQTQEQAARRFSHELHDELGQSLAAVRSNLTRAAWEKTETLRNDSLQLVDESIANVRELSQLLRPVILDDFGLDAGLRWLTEKFAQRTRLEVDYSADGMGRYADETETHLFRIAQEALTNIARHAEATRVKVRVSSDGETIRLLIEDNGKGIGEAEEGGVVGTLGMVGMRARARQCGGEFHAARVEPHGLCIQVAVPVRLPAAAPGD